MAKNLSTSKRVQVALRNRRLNKNYKSAIKTMMKKIFVEIDNIKHAPSNTRAQFLLSQTYSKIDKAVKKGVIHQNNAARKKSRIVNRLKSVLK